MTGRHREPAAIDSDWMDAANCVGLDPTVFFDPRHEAEAKAICAGCEVRTECLHVALELNVAEGIWGGEDYTARRRLRRERLKAARNAR
jgi:WhiB family transcriptional regulator, redox-sensing transcriptional regulator